ncbi:MAG: DUF5667 domain-containing protein [bacterium]|nr:DUF5667 domain-containing protein [bacterium]
MKKIMGLFVLILLSLSMVTAAHTESSLEVETVVDAGVTPDSILYGIDLALDKISLALKVSSEKKVAKGLEIAQERLLEVRAMLQAGNAEAAAEAEAEHGKALTKIETELETFDAESSQEELETELELEVEVEKHKERVKDLKITIKGDFSDEEISALVESILSNLEGQTSSLEINIKQKKGQTKITIEQEGTDAEELEDSLEESLGIDLEEEEEDARKDLSQAEQQITKAQEKIDSEIAQGRDASVSVALLLEAQESYAQALVAFEAGDFDAVEDFAEDAWDLANEARKGKNFEKEDSGDDETESTEVELELDEDDSKDKGKNKDDSEEEEESEEDVSVDAEVEL